MILDTTSKTIEVVLGGAITTNQLEITADWADTANGLTFAPGGTSLLTNGATAVTAVASPAANVQRQVKSLVIYNADTVNATVTVRMFDGTNRRRFIVVTLTPGSSLIFSPEFGWGIMPSAPVTMSQISDYQTGTWTPTDASGAGLVFTTADGAYVKAGKLVFFSGRITYPTTANGATSLIGSLPFSVNNADANYSPFSVQSIIPGSTPVQGLTIVNSTTFQLYAIGTNTQILNSQLSTTTIRFAGVYQSS